MLLNEEIYQSEIARIIAAFERLGVSKKALAPIKKQSGTPDERLLYRLIAIADTLETYAESHSNDSQPGI